jgi:hypothetical protein
MRTSIAGGGMSQTGKKEGAEKSARSLSLMHRFT